MQGAQAGLKDGTQDGLSLAAVMQNGLGLRNIDGNHRVHEIILYNIIFT